MATWARAVMFVLLCGFVDAEAQINQAQTAFAIVTPEFGNPDGLFAVETLFNRSFFGLQQTNTSAAPPLLAASFNVNIAGASEDTTGIAIVNPNATVANVRLSVTNDLGIEVLNQTVAILPRGQLTRFLSELFGIPFRTNSPGLMTIVSDVPVGIQPVNFRDGSLAATPVFSLTSPFPLPSTTFIPSASSTSRSGTTTGGGPSNGGTGAVGPVATTIGGPEASLFPQVVNGGGWFTEIAISNISLRSQSVRIDLFDPAGIAIISIVGISVPSRGQVIFSTQTGTIVTRFQ
jgi:hypothetical protein